MFEECKESFTGVEYIGNKTITIGNHSCLPWVDFKDNLKKWNTSLTENYCRNPNITDHGPWCFINIQGNSEYCEIHYCSGTVNYFSQKYFLL